MSDALPRNITLIGRLKKEWSRISRDIYSESYTSRQEIVPLDESTQAGAKEKPPLPGALISNGAAYRIRTYDVLIRSQTLYPAEVTPQLVDYYAQGLNNSQAFFQKKLSNLIFNHLMQSIDSILSNTAKATPQVCRHIRKASVTGGFKVQLVRRIGFRASAARIRTGFARLPARSPAG